MKLKVIALSAAFAAAAFAASAQTTENISKDIFVGGGVGVISTMTPGLNTPSVYVNLQVGHYITPVWGVRAVIGGPFQTLSASENTALITSSGTDRYSSKNKLFGELNADIMVNFSNIWAKDLAKFDVYLFAGPTLNFSSEGTKFSASQTADVYTVEESDAFKVRMGATVGLGLAYNFTPSFALGLEGRLGVTPSIFGDADAYRKNSGTARLSLQAVWNIGGKNGKSARAAAAAAAAGYISKEAAEALAQEAVENNPKIVEKIVEKEVVKEVEKVVYKSAPSSTAIFFEIGSAKISDKDKVRIKLLAEGINATDDVVYEVAGYADKKTGSSKRNQQLAEQRAQAVYDLLVEEGVDADRLELKAYGGVDAMFYNNDALSRTVIVSQK